MPSFSVSLEKSLHRALSIARAHKHEFATLEHLLLALLEDPDVVEVMQGCHIDLALLRRNLERYIQTELEILLVAFCEESKPTTSFHRVIQRAVVHVQSAGHEEVTGANVLVALFSERDSQAVYFLQEQDMTRYDAVNYISHGIVKGEAHLSDSFREDTPQESQEASEERSDESGGHSEKGDVLESYCVNLNKKASEGKIDPLIGRKQELQRAIQILCRRQKNNPLFVGESGVGKTAIAEGLALHIVEGNVPDILKQTVIYSLNMGALLAGTRYRGDFEERLRRVVKAVEQHPSAIMFIDEIHTIIGAGATASGAMDASNLLKPALATGEFRCIGSTTYKEYRQFFEKDQALLRRFQKIDVHEPSLEESIEILRGLKLRFESYHHVRYTREALKLAVELSDRYLYDRKLPDKAIDVLDETAASQALLPEARRRRIIGAKEIEATIATMARVPPKTVSKDDTRLLAKLEQDLKRVIYGQEHAIQTLAAAVKMARAGLREPEKPIGNYLFSGPTGVGKTEVARQLALLMGMELVRFDMSEYMEKHTVSRLIGAPPGYVGFDQGGLLTDRVDHNPHCVVLLDEIEKAHPDVFNILLQVMDHGKLTDHNGKQVSFRNTILVMTTNAGASDLAREPMGFSQLKRVGDDKEAINRFFTPEFRNRLDAIIPFKSLSEPVIHQIVIKFVTQLEVQLAERGVTFRLTEAAIRWLARKGYDTQMGARPLARVVQEAIKKPLAEEVLFGKLRKGGLVSVDTSPEGEESLVFQIEEDTVPRVKKNKAPSCRTPFGTFRKESSSLSPVNFSVPRKKIPEESFH